MLFYFWQIREYRRSRHDELIDMRFVFTSAYVDSRVAMGLHCGQSTESLLGMVEGGDRRAARANLMNVPSLQTRGAPKLDKKLYRDAPGWSTMRRGGLRTALLSDARENERPSRLDELGSRLEKDRAPAARRSRHAMQMPSSASDVVDGGDYVFPYMDRRRDYWLNDRIGDGEALDFPLDLGEELDERRLVSTHEISARQYKDSAAGSYTFCCF